jgi:glycosyltransferase involved in cell wall biosynthesis
MGGRFNLRYLFAVCRLAVRTRSNVLHSHLLGSNVYCGIAGLLVKARVIAVFHGAVDLKPSRFDPVKRAILRMRHVRAVAVSNGTLESLVLWGLEREKISVIPNGVDTSYFTPSRNSALRDELNVPDCNVLVGAVGNIRAPKAYDLLLHAISRVAAPHAQFVVVGEGTDEALLYLRELAAQLGVAQRVHFLGYRSVTPTLLASFDVLVSSSRSEGLPLAFLEAMAVGVPIVATPTAGALELIKHEETGLVARGFDPDALANAIDQALTSPKLRAELGTKARSFVESRFSVGRMLEAYDRLCSS